MRACQAESPGRDGRPGALQGRGGRPAAYLVALGAEGVVRVAGTGLAAPAAGQLPVVGGTLVTLGAHHVGQTHAAPRLLVTWHVPPGAQDATVTACTGGGLLSWGGTQICPPPPPRGSASGRRTRRGTFLQKTWLTHEATALPTSPSTWPLGHPPALHWACSVLTSKPGLRCHMLEAAGIATGMPNRGAGPAPGPPAPPHGRLGRCTHGGSPAGWRR